MDGTTLLGVAAIITALGGVLSVLLTTLVTIRRVVTVAAEVKSVHTEVAAVAGQVADVHTEVKTANALTIAQLADADETRRIEQIPPGDRTAEEDEHITDTQATHGGTP